MQSLDSLLVTVDHSGNFASVNDNESFQKVFGVTVTEEDIGRSFTEVLQW